MYYNHEFVKIPKPCNFQGGGGGGRYTHHCPLEYVTVGAWGIPVLNA